MVDACVSGLEPKGYLWRIFQMNRLIIYMYSGEF